jgi:hypothetical protein
MIDIIGNELPENEITVLLITFLIGIFYSRIRNNIKIDKEIKYADIGISFLFLSRLFTVLEHLYLPNLFDILEHISLLLFTFSISIYFYLYIQEKGEKIEYS